MLTYLMKLIPIFVIYGCVGKLMIIKTQRPCRQWHNRNLMVYYIQGQIIENEVPQTQTSSKT
jgi:hypothetical protein